MVQGRIHGISFSVCRRHKGADAPVNKSDMTSFFHPLDKQLSDKVLHSPLMEKAVRLIINERLDEINQYVHQATHVRVNSEHPCVEYLREGCNFFGVDEIPPLYVRRSYRYDVECIGYKTPVVLVPELLLRDAPDGLLRGRMMSVAASIRAGHHKLGFLLWLDENFSGIIPLPFVGDAFRALLYEWQRAQKYSQDRAFYLAVENEKLALENLLFGEMPESVRDNFTYGDSDTFDKQVEDFYRMDSILDAAAALQGMLQCEIWIPARYKELKAFMQTQGGMYHVG